MFAAMHFKEYFTALFHGWVGKMSGPASIALLFLPLVWPSLFKDATLVRATWVAAALCFVVANYSAWRYERNKYESEVAKHDKPDIRGSASHFANYDGGHVDRIIHDGNKRSTEFKVAFRLELCNHSAVKTNVRRLLFDGSRVVPALEMAESAIALVDLNRGIGVTLSPSTSVTIGGAYADFKGKEIDLTNLEITVVDGFHNHHLVKTLPGSSLWIS
jgi:hypothetical protein